MYRLTRLLQGLADVRIQGAQPTRFLNACAQAEIPFYAAEPTDEFTLHLTLRRQDLKRAAHLAQRSQCSVETLRERGAPRLLQRMKKRLLLPIGLAVICAALIWSFLHVWELEVVGNERATTAEILSALDEAGVHIGSFWPSFSNERIKSQVLQKVPELSWIAVNVRGSRAIASVRERVDAPELYDEKQAVEIAAEKAGVLTQLQVLQGTAVAKAGQTVLPGELLVSAEMTSSFEKAGTRTVHAKAQVYARTWYTLTACAPLERMEKVYTGRSRLGLALELGDRRINFLNVTDNSGNSDVNYDKLSKSRRFALDGTFATPLALTVERLHAYTLEPVRMNETQLRTQLQKQLSEQLAHEIGADGEVKSQEYSVSDRDGMLYVILRAECVEDIALERAYAFDQPAETYEIKGEESQ